MGTPDFAVPALRALVAAGHEVACVYCQPPRPAGRGQKARPCPVQQAAEGFGLPVRTPPSLKDATDQAEFHALDLDAAVVAAYGLILPDAILEAPRLGCINIHASLLPRWRGAAPIQRAILAGDSESGVTIMQVEQKLDAGPILLAEAVPITAETTGQSLHDELAEIGARLVVEALDGIAAGTVTPQPQPEEGVTYAHKLERAEGMLDWREPADALERKVRAFTPWPGAWFELDGERIKLLTVELVPGDGAAGEVLDDRLTVACGNGALRPVRLQRQGRKPMNIDEFLRGFPVARGTRLP